MKIWVSVELSSTISNRHWVILFLRNVLLRMSVAPQADRVIWRSRSRLTIAQWQGFTFCQMLPSL
jgi:hypothetical protein